MKLLMMGASQAQAFEPTNPTYAIQIFSDFNGKPFRSASLRDSPLYRRVKEYCFDDLDIVSSGGGQVWFSSDQARDILTDFRDHCEGIETLLTHCSRGRNRSPAVTLALNDIFDLGGNSREIIRTKGIFPNRHVYKTLREAGEELGLDTSRMHRTWELMQIYDTP